MPVGAVVGASVIGAGATIVAGSKAAKAQSQAADKSAETELYMYDTTRADYAPWRAAGSTALSALMQLYGLPSGNFGAPSGFQTGGTGSLPNAPEPAPPPYESGGLFPSLVRRTMIERIKSGATLDPDRLQQMGLADYAARYRAWRQGGQAASPAPGGATATPPAPYGGLLTSPGYRFRLDEGIKALERSASARGLRKGPVYGMSGATAKAVQRYGEGLAASEYDSYAARLAQLAGFGQSATAGTAAAGASYAQGASNAYMAAGNARASGYANTASAINSGLNNVMTAYLWQQNPYGRSG